MKKIAFFIGGMGWGGAERVISILANKFIKLGYNVDIVTLLNNNNVFKLNEKINIVSFVRENKKRIFNVFYWLKSIREYLRSQNPDIAVSFVCRINILFLIACSQIHFKNKTVISERNDPRYDGRGFISRVMTNIYYPNADAIICQSNVQKEFFCKKIQNKIVVIKNPTDLKTHVLDFYEKKKIIINAARYDKSKNQILIIKAFEKILNENKNHDFVLHFYGSGPCKTKLQKYIEGKQLNNNISVFESVDNIQDKISEASIFCLSSNYEGMSNSLIEAMMLGTASISTNVCGAKDLINDGENGFIIPVNNMKMLYSRLLTLIESEDVRKRFYLNCTSDKFRKPFVESIDEYISTIVS